MSSPELGRGEKIISQKDSVVYEVLRTSGIEFWIRRKAVTSDLIIKPEPGEPLIERQQGFKQSFKNSHLGQALEQRKRK